MIVLIITYLLIAVPLAMIAARAAGVQPIPSARLR